MFGLGPLLSWLIGGAAAAALVIVGEAFWIEALRAEVAEARQHEAEARQQASDINTLVAQNELKNERARDKQERKNAQERLDIETKRNTLQATLNQKQRDYDAVSAELKGIIKNAPPGDSVELGPTMRLYFDRLRERQAQWHAADGTVAP